MTIYASASEIIGNTPLVELARYGRAHGLNARIVGKVEALNPAGSAKDRVAKTMLERAAAAGLINEYTVIIEPTSGNTGIGLAAIAATMGNRLLIVMPENMSEERRQLMRAYGARVVLTDAALGMAGAIEKANNLAAELGNAFIPSQFANPDNPAAHEATTGPEIWRDTDGAVDILVAGVGTGGTLTGTGRFLKARNPQVRVVAVEPSGSAVLSGGAAGPHAIAGIGAGFVPDTFDAQVCDEVVPIGDEEAAETAREVARAEGLLVGVSSGAAVAAARRLAERPENAEKLIVVILPDSGERYLSTGLFD